MDTTAKVVHKFEIKLQKHNIFNNTFKLSEKQKLVQDFIIYLQDVTISGDFSIGLGGLFLNTCVKNHNGHDLMEKAVFCYAKSREETQQKGRPYKVLSKNESNSTRLFTIHQLVHLIHLDSSSRFLRIIGKLSHCLMYKKNEMTIFRDFFNSIKHSDVELICSDYQVLPAHRPILTIHSSVFEDMLKNHLLLRNFTFLDISGDVMLEILRYIYRKEVEDLKKLAPKIYLGADKFKLYELKDMCVKSMIENLSMDNVIDYFKLADEYNEDFLLKKCARFIKFNYANIREKDLWEELSKDQVLVILDIFEKNTRNFHYYEF